MADVGKLQQDIDNERLKFLALRQKLATTLSAFKASPNATDHLTPKDKDNERTR